jgi:hypothetical protein
MLTIAKKHKAWFRITITENGEVIVERIIIRGEKSPRYYLYTNDNASHYHPGLLLIMRRIARC